MKLKKCVRPLVFVNPFVFPKSEPLILHKQFKNLFSELESGHFEIYDRVNSFPEKGYELEKKLSEEIDRFDPWRLQIVDQLAEISDNFNFEERKAHQDYIQNTRYYQIVQEAPFYWRIMNKPNGYPGDAQMMSYIYNNTFEGDTPFGMFLHKHALSTKACQSVRNRKLYLTDQILKNKSGNILSLAAGPAQEIREVLANSRNNHLRFLALDHDMETLRKFSVSKNEDRFQYVLANAFNIISGDYRTATPKDYMFQFCYPRKDFKGFRKLFCNLKYTMGFLKPEEYDLVYSAGLFDYIKTYPLDDSKGAVALTKNLFSRVKPGGSLIVGNFNYKNPRDLRFVMEYIYDWQLIYRDEQDMFDFARTIPDSEIEDIQLIEEATGINYFLKIIKNN